MKKVHSFVRDENFFQKIVRKKSFWFIFCFLSLSVPIYRSINRTLPPPLPIYYQLPEFLHINEFNQPFGLKDLRGKYFIASFMFTTCVSSCPPLMDKLDMVQKRIKGLGTRVAIVSFTVDPQHDTPAVLYKYARKRHTNPFVWKFITGKKEELEKTIIHGFKVPMGEREQIEKKVGDAEISLVDIAHTEKFVLVDDKGQIRGYYSTDKVSIDKLMIDLGLLVNNSFSKEDKY